MNEQRLKRMDEGINERMNEWTSEWLKEQKSDWMSEQPHVCRNNECISDWKQNHRNKQTNG